jgi:hypothetical protein
MKTSLYCHITNSAESFNCNFEDQKSGFFEELRRSERLGTDGETHFKAPQPSGDLLEIRAVRLNSGGGVGVFHYPKGKSEKLIASADSVWSLKSHSACWPNIVKNVQEWAQFNVALGNPISLPNEHYLKTKIPWCIISFRPDSDEYGLEIIKPVIDVIVSTTFAMIEANIKASN